MFLVVLVAATWFKAHENHRDTRIQAQWRERIAVLEAEGKVEYQRLVRLIASTQNVSRSELEAKLNNGRQFDLQANGSRLEARWTHPDYGIPVHLSFENDMLRSWNMSGGSPAMLPGNAQPKPRRFDSQAETIRHAAQLISAYAWLVAFCVTVARPKHVWLAAQAMLALALAYGAATVVSPVYSLTIRGIVSNDSLFWAAMMYLVALIALSTACPAKVRKLQFQLRHLLLAITCAALLLVIGPLGDFALCVFAGGFLVLVTLLVPRWTKL
ncbi:MAG: hypothetical protein WDZ59_02510 [Pirellulales bacterium]